MRIRKILSIGELSWLEPAVDKTLGNGFNAEKFRRLVSAHDVESMVIVGHEPDFTRVIRALTGAVVVLAKSGVAVVELEESCTKGKLGWLFPRASRSIVDDTQAAVANGGRFGVIPGVYDAHGSRHGMKLPVLPHASSFGRTFLESEPPLSCISFPTRKV